MLAALINGGQLIVTVNGDQLSAAEADLLDAASSAGGGGGLTVDPVSPGTAPRTDSFTAVPGTLYRVDASAAATITLPDAASNLGRSLTIKNQTADTSDVTIAAAGSDTVDGGATIVLAGAYAQMTLQSDGADWMSNQQETNQGPLKN